VGVGKSSTPTPTGRFWIRERMKLSDRSNAYYAYALGTSAYSSLTESPRVQLGTPVYIIR
jgi:hypothetical protein